MLKARTRPGLENAPSRPREPLWRASNFRNLWIAESISQVGSQVSLVALPLLAIFVLDAAPSQMGFLSAAGSIPFLLIGLFVGVWVDRVRRRPLMVIADLARGALLLLIPVAWAMDVLRIEILYVIAVLTGSLTVVFDVAWQAYVPSIVRRERLVEANSKLQLSASVAQVTGPGAGGALVGLVTAPMAILIDALSYFASALFLFRIGSHEEDGARSDARIDIRRDVAEGIRTVYENAMLRALIYAKVVRTFAAGIFFAVYVLFMADDLGLGATTIGLVFGLGGIGSLAGAAIAERAARWRGEGNAVIGGQFLFGLFAVTLPIAVFFPRYALLMVILSELLQWMTYIVAHVSEITIRQTSVPDRFLGRVSAVFQFFGGGTTPLGAIAGGVLGELIGVPMTLVVASAGFFLAFIFVLLSPLRGYRTPPEAAEELA
jgi:MFS family permease